MTGHKEFFAELRAAREAKGVTLDDISRTTLIDRKYLDAIEHAQEDVLPTAYVRAFIREYAGAIGLNPDEVMQKFDHVSRTDSSMPPSIEPAEQPPAQGSSPTARKPWWENRWLLIGIIGIAAVGVIALVLDLTQTRPARVTPEIPFSTAIRENEQRLFPGDSTRPAASPLRSDSLVLYAASLDSVWMELSIDGTPPVDYLFPPNIRRQWKAKETFTITLGNGGGMVFRLNTTEIGTIGKPGSVVRNFELSRKTLVSQKSSGATP